MRRLSRRLLQSFQSSSLISRHYLIALFVLCTLAFAGQARAERIDQFNEFENHGQHYFSVQLHDSADRWLLFFANGRLSDREILLKLIYDKHHRLGPSASGGWWWGGDPRHDRNDDPVSAVPEPSSLLLMSAGLFGLGAALKNRLAASGS